MHASRSLAGLLFVVSSAALIAPAVSQEREPRRIVRNICWTPEGSMSCKAFQAGLQDPAREVRGEVVRLMVALNYVESAANCGVQEALLFELLQPRSSVEVRRAAARLLGRFGRDGASLGATVRLLAESDEVIRRQAVSDVGGMAENYEFFADELATLAVHPDVEVRRAVTQAYRRLGKMMPTSLAAGRLAALPPPAAPRRLGGSRPRDYEEAQQLWAQLAGSDEAPEDALRQFDGFFLLTNNPEAHPPPGAEARREAALRWLRRVPPSERARLRAHFYLWSAGQWKAPE